MRRLTARSLHWTCPQCRQSNAEILQDRPRPHVVSAAMLPGTPKAAAQQEKGEGPAQADARPQDTTPASAPENAPIPSHNDRPRDEEVYNVDRPVLQSTKPPTPAPTLDGPPLPAPGLPLVATALQRRELSVLQAQIESCRRILLLLDSLMGLVCALLVLLILKNL